MDDSNILLLLKNSPSKGLYEATKKYGGMVEAITKKILYRNEEDIEECVADTFVTLWKNTNDVEFQRGTLKGYIACIARNKAIDRYRKLCKDSTVYIEDKEIVSATDIEEEIVIKSDVEVVQEIINDMGESDKEIFIRRFFWFEKVKEIAINLGLTEKNVENRIYRGRKRLKQVLIERGVTI